MIIKMDISVEDILDEMDKFDYNDLVYKCDYSMLLKEMNTHKLFDAIDSHVKSGSDPQFNQAYNQWRHNK